MRGTLQHCRCSFFIFLAFIFGAAQRLGWRSSHRIISTGDLHSFPLFGARAPQVFAEHRRNMVYRLTKRPLFGGAIDIDVPSAWRDVSEVRQVPDHQEVWQDCTVEGQAPSELAAAAAGEPISIEGTGGVLVVEILARQDDVSDDTAAKFFFDDLAESNGAIADEERRLDFAQVTCAGGVSCSDDTNSLMPRLDKSLTACTCIGVQRVALGKDREVGGDSEPRSDHWAVRIEMCVLRLEKEETDLLISMTRPIQDGSEKTMKDIMEASTHSKLFLEIIETFSIQNWELFG